MPKTMLAGFAQVIVGVIFDDDCHIHHVASGAVKLSAVPMGVKSEGT